MVEHHRSACTPSGKETGIDAVVLSGGVFMNALLAREAAHSLLQAGFRVYRHHLVPPNDGGLSLGQLAVAAAEHTHPPRRPHATSHGGRLGTWSMSDRIAISLSLRVPVF